MMNSTDVESAVSARGLIVRRGRSEILHGLDLDLAPGSVTGLLGPSGCGKTTLMRSMVGVQRISGGSLTLLGLPAGHPDLRRRVAYTSQSLSIYSDVSVAGNVSYFAGLIGAGKAAVAQAIERVRLSDFADRRVDQLSGGQAGRASLACALVGRPELLILDEPTVGLDPVTKAALWDTFRGLADEGVTLLISSHVMDEAIRCDSALFMREGHFLAHEAVTSLQARTGTTNPEAAFVALIEAAA